MVQETSVAAVERAAAFCLRQGQTTRKAFLRNFLFSGKEDPNLRDHEPVGCDARIALETTLSLALRHPSEVNEIENINVFFCTRRYYWLSYGALGLQFEGPPGPEKECVEDFLDTYVKVPPDDAAGVVGVRG